MRADAADLDDLFGSIRLEATVDIAAPRPTVWEVLTDVTTTPRHSPEVVAVTWLDGHDRLAVGARFAGTNRQRADTLPAGLGLGAQGGYLTWTRECVVTWFEPLAGFGYDVLDRFCDIATSWVVRLDDAPTGTRVRQQFRHSRTGRSGIRIAADADPTRAEAIVRRRSAQLEAGMHETLESYRITVEELVRAGDPPGQLA